MVLMWVRYGSAMTDNSGIRQTFVEAYPQYVARLLVDRGVEIGPTIADGIVAGTETIDKLLAPASNLRWPTTTSEHCFHGIDTGSRPDLHVR